MLIPNACYIIGSGASIRNSKWNIPAQDLPIWNILKDKFTVSLNWGYKFINPTVELFVDYRFIDTQLDKLKELNLLVCKDDPFFIREKDKYVEIINKNLFLLKNSTTYTGSRAWKDGFFCGQLSGIYAISFVIELGVKNIYLLGYDANETDGYTHFYQDDGVTGHMKWDNQNQTGVGKDSRGYYNTGTYNKDVNTWFDPFKFVNNVNIFNVNMKSGINIFPKISYETMFNDLIKENQNINQLETQEHIKEIINVKTSEL
jgi:hypothetical protein